MTDNTLQTSRPRLYDALNTAKTLITSLCIQFRQDGIASVAAVAEDINIVGAFRIFGDLWHRIQSPGADRRFDIFILWVTGSTGLSGLGRSCSSVSTIGISFTGNTTPEFSVFGVRPRWSSFSPSWLDFLEAIPTSYEILKTGNFRLVLHF
jgi:hypothetical protein